MCIPFEVPDSPGQVYYRNAGSTVHRGGELTVRFSPASFLDLNSSLTYTNAFYKEYAHGEVDNSGNKIPGARYYEPGPGRTFFVIFRMEIGKLKIPGK